MNKKPSKGLFLSCTFILKLMPIGRNELRPYKSSQRPPLFTWIVKAVIGKAEVGE